MTHPVQREEDVRGFEVTVHDAALVHVGDGGSDLRKILPYHALIESRLFLLRLSQLALEVPSFGVLKHEDELLALNEPVKVAAAEKATFGGSVQHQVQEGGSLARSLAKKEPTYIMLSWLSD